MALSASIALTTNTATINQQVNAQLTVSNSGGSSVNLIQIVPHTRKTGSAIQDLNSGVAVSGPSLGPSQNVTIPAGGSLIFPLSYTFFSPSRIQGGGGYGDGTFDCRCLCYGADGSVFAATAATVTVSPIFQFSQEL